MVCGYIHRGPEPPDECPICGADRTDFEPYTEEKAAPAREAGDAWRCVVCGYEHEGREPPDECPVCGAAKHQFERASKEEGIEGGRSTAENIVVVGAGIAGLSAVEAIRAISADVAVTFLSREEHLPYYRLNLTRFLAGEIEEKDLPLHTESWYGEKNVDLRTGVEVSGILPEEKTLELDTGEVLAYDRLILTVGSHPYVPPFGGTKREGVTIFRTVDDAKRIREAGREDHPVVCIGGGILGLETAGALARLGVKVTLLEAHDWLMPRQLNRRAGEMLTEHARSFGVEIVTNAMTRRIAGGERVEAVELEDGTALPAGFVVIAAGVRPNSHLARRAGIDVNLGILVDDHLATSHPDIYAAGDVAEHRGTLYGLWGAAQYQGSIAGMNATGRETEFGGIPRSNTLKVLGYDMFSIGHIEPADGSYRVVESKEGPDYARFLFRDNRMVGAVLLGDTSATGRVKKAIENRRDFSGLLKSLPNAKEVIDHLKGDS